MENRELVCVACPLGCPITVTFDADGNVETVTGNTCKRGDAYARTEIKNPMRSIHSTVKVNGVTQNIASNELDLDVASNLITEAQYSELQTIFS